MTSRHLFFKAMREDLRHKTWMLALSILGSFIILPVAWLLFCDNMGNYTNAATEIRQVTRQTINFFGEYVIILGAIFTYAGALIVGLWGFRFLHHKNMVDTWHSMPIKRDTLFGVCWLNGFLLWLVPYAAAMLVTCLLAAGKLISVGAAESIGKMLATAALSFLALLICFLLVYNLILIAVMLSGNILNTLVSMGVLGVGVIGVYALCIAFFETYMSTFHTGGLNLECVSYFSPLYSAGYLLYARLKFLEEPVRIWIVFGVNFLISMGMGAACWFLYRKRASELAEQGIKNKPLIFLMKLIVGVAAGMCGWMLMYLMVSNAAVAWGVFGCILVAVVVFGIMDIIFYMDFKAFLKHKAQMGLTVAVSLLMCFCFYFDWMGYDGYLPDKEDVAEIAIYCSSYCNRYSYGGVVEFLNEMHIQDVDAAYAFLERSVENVDGFGKERANYYYSTVDYYDYSVTSIPVRVRLKNGKDYYRYYRLSNYDWDVLQPLIMSEEYLTKIYALDEEDMEYCYRMRFERRDIVSVSSRTTPKADIIAVMKAYNEDLFTNPESVLANDNRLLVRIYIDRDMPNGYREVYLDVYENMTNTVAKLKELGYGEWVAEVAAEDVSEIRLRLGAYPEADTTSEQLIAYARQNYGVYLPGQTEEDIWKILEEVGNGIYYSEGYEYEAIYEEKVSVTPIATMEYAKEPYLSITDRDEIEEILSLLSYMDRFQNPIFTRERLSTEVREKDGNDYVLRIPVGVLPEKYIQRFGDLDLNAFCR